MANILLHTWYSCVIKSQDVVGIEYPIGANALFSLRYRDGNNAIFAIMYTKQDSVDRYKYIKNKKIKDEIQLEFCNSAAELSHSVIWKLGNLQEHTSSHKYEDLFKEHISLISIEEETHILLSFFNLI